MRSQSGDGEQSAAPEHVDEQRLLVRPGGVPHDHVAGHPDPAHVEARRAADLDVDDGEGDRDAGAALDHLVEQQVARVGVVLLVSVEAEFAEQELVGGLDLHEWLGGGVDARLQAEPPLAQLRLVAVDVEAGTLALRDQQGGTREGHVVPGLPEGGAELVGQVGERCVRRSGHATANPSTRHSFTKSSDTSTATPSIGTGGASRM